MMSASPTLRRVIASAWWPGPQALVLYMLLAIPAGANPSIEHDGALLGGGRGDVLQDMLRQRNVSLISRTGGIGIADALLRATRQAQGVA
jgi:Rod binding domain-containing protein